MSGGMHLLDTYVYTLLLQDLRNPPTRARHIYGNAMGIGIGYNSSIYKV